MKKNITVLGTGLMGAPIAERLANEGYNVSVYNRTGSKAKKLESSGIKVYDNPADAVSVSDFIIVMVADYRAVNSVLFPDSNSDFNGKTIIQMSTISPEQNITLKKEIEKAGGIFVEAPVLGGVTQAKSGELIIMVSCSEQEFKNLSGLFAVLSKNVKLVPGAGKASSLKLAFNQMIATMNSAFQMSLGYVLEKGIDLDTFMGILRSSALYAPAFDKKMDNYLNRDHENVNFSLKLLLKDVNLIIDEFEKSQVDCLTVKGVKFLLDRGIHFDLGEKDYSALFEIIYPKK